MNNIPTFSIIIPTYNREYCLERALASVFNQTYQDFEVIVIDDGSTDGTFLLLSNIPDPRLRIISLDNNMGVSNARNIGAKEAKGKYLSLLDSDDEYFPEFLEKTLLYFKDTDDQVGFCWTGKRSLRLWADQDRQRKLIHESTWMPIFGNFNEATKYCLTCDPPWGTSNGVTFKKGVLEDVGGFDVALKAREDVDLLIRLFEKYNFIVIPDILVTYHNDAYDRVDSGLLKRSLSYQHMYNKYIDKIKSDPDSVKFFNNMIVECLYNSGNKIKSLNWLVKQIFTANQKKYIIYLIIKVIIPLRIAMKTF